MVHIGSAEQWNGNLVYNWNTDEDKRMQEIRDPTSNNVVGFLDVNWTALAGPNKRDWANDPLYIRSEAERIGKPWTYKLEISQVKDLPANYSHSYISYEFCGETFSSDINKEYSTSPLINYAQVHHVQYVTKEFIQFLKGPLEIKLFAALQNANFMVSN